jgi:hypothetical protein
MLIRDTATIIAVYNELASNIHSFTSRSSLLSLLKVAVLEIHPFLGPRVEDRW